MVNLCENGGWVVEVAESLGLACKFEGALFVVFLIAHLSGSRARLEKSPTNQVLPHAHTPTHTPSHEVKAITKTNPLKKNEHQIKA